MRACKVSFHTALLAFWAVFSSLGQSQETARASPSHFEASDHSVSFRYSYPAVLCQEGGRSGCQLDDLHLCGTENVIACVMYGGKRYAQYNFRSAALSIGTLPEAKDEAVCLDVPGTDISMERINGVLFKSSEDSEGAAGTLVGHTYYRAFQNGQCYEADLSVATTNYGAVDHTKVKELKPMDYRSIYRTLKQVLDTLRISSSQAKDRAER